MKFLIDTNAEHCKNCQSWSVKSIISDRYVVLSVDGRSGEAFVNISCHTQGGVLLDSRRLVMLAQSALELAYQIDPGLVSRFEHKEPEEPEAASNPDTVSTALTTSHAEIAGCPSGGVCNASICTSSQPLLNGGTTCE